MYPTVEQVRLRPGQMIFETTAQFGPGHAVDQIFEVEMFALHVKPGRINGLGQVGVVQTQLTHHLGDGGPNTVGAAAAQCDETTIGLFDDRGSHH